MFKYKISYKPFKNAYTNIMITEADSLMDANANFLKYFPQGIVISISPVVDDRPIAEVIIIDFKERKRIAS